MMSMGGRSSRLAGIALITIGLVFFAFLVIPTEFEPFGADPNTHQIQCDVTISNPILEDPRIDSLVCEDLGLCNTGFLGIQLGIVDLLIPPEKGKAILESGGQRASKGYSVQLTESQTVTLSVCSRTTTGDITLVDSNSNPIDQKSFEAV